MNALHLGNFGQPKPPRLAVATPELCDLAKKILDARAKFLAVETKTSADRKKMPKVRADIRLLKQTLLDTDINHMSQMLEKGWPINPIVAKIIGDTRADIWSLMGSVRIMKTTQKVMSLVSLSAGIQNPVFALLPAYLRMEYQEGLKEGRDLDLNKALHDLYGYGELELRLWINNDSFMLNNVDVVRSQVALFRRSLDVERIQAERSEKKLRSAEEEYNKARNALSALYRKWPGWGHKYMKDILDDLEAMAEACARQLALRPLRMPSPTMRRAPLPPPEVPTFMPPAVTVPPAIPPITAIPPSAPLVYVPISVPSFVTPQSLYMVR